MTQARACSPARSTAASTSHLSPGRATCTSSSSSRTLAPPTRPGRTRRRLSSTSARCATAQPQRVRGVARAAQPAAESQPSGGKGVQQLPKHIKCRQPAAQAQPGRVHEVAITARVHQLGQRSGRVGLKLSIKSDALLAALARCEPSIVCSPWCALLQITHLRPGLAARVPCMALKRNFARDTL
jgi:hypothetical protein